LYVNRNAGAFVFLAADLRDLRTNWLIVGIFLQPFASCSATQGIFPLADVLRKGTAVASLAYFSYARMAANVIVQDIDKKNMPHLSGRTSSIAP
jgi:hypothetical protein